MTEVISIDTPALGDRIYLATDGRVALVVDPQRDIDRVLAAAAGRGVLITHVFETHIHNDYVSGGLALARVTGAAYHVNADDEVAFDRTPVTDGDAIAVGDTMAVQVIATIAAIAIGTMVRFSMIKASPKRYSDRRDYSFDMQ